MNAEIIAIGTEILLGDILNTNAKYLAKQLAHLGISLFYQTVVGDNQERIVQAYENAFKRADLVITTGGLGPTDDDMSKEMAAKYFGKSLVLHQPTMDKLIGFFERIGQPMTENNKKQAYIIEDSQLLENDFGTAPGCLLEQDGKVIILMPGPPREMIPMFENKVIPFLQTKSNQVFFSKTLRVCGVGESAAESMLKELIDSQTNPTIAPYAKTSEVHFRVTARAKDQAEAKTIMQPTIDAIYAILGDNIYAEDSMSLEESVSKLLVAKKLTIACAESCTGGLLTAQLVNFPGISEVLLESLVTYSNHAKVNRLGVSQKTLDKYGSVSEQTAMEMAQGVAKTSGASVGVGITGVAGPGGATAQKPVGLVYIAVATKEETVVKRIVVPGERALVRSRAVVAALDFIRRTIS